MILSSFKKQKYEDILYFSKMQNIPNMGQASALKLASNVALNFNNMYLIYQFIHPHSQEFAME